MFRGRLINGDCDPLTETCICDSNYYGEGCHKLCVNGVFTNGNCNCSEGYEGLTCETEIRDRYLGGWDVLEWTSAFHIGPHRFLGFHQPL